MLAHDYAKAIAPIIQKRDASEEVLQELDRVLASRGHQKLKRQILTALCTQLIKEARAHEVIVRVAKTEHAAAYADTIDAACKELGITAKPRIVIDDSLAGGFLIQTNDHLFDMSYKRTLIELYRTIIKSS